MPVCAITLLLRRWSSCSSRGSRDVEPLVDAGVDWSWCLILALGDVEPAWVNAVWAVRDGAVGAVTKYQQLSHKDEIWTVDSQIDITRLRLASDKPLPRLRTLPDNLHGILLVLALARERKLVLRLAIRNLIDTEPLVRCPQQPRQMPLHVLDIVQLRRERVVDVDDDDLPVGLALVQQGHHAQHLHLLDVTRLGDQLADLADVERVIVALLLGLGVGDVGVLPGLGEGTVVPQVAFVREAVADEAKLALLSVLLDGVENFVFRDLNITSC